MDNEQKALKIFELIVNKTMPKDQLGFYTERDMLTDILRILNQ